MKCPHCLENFHSNPTGGRLGTTDGSAKDRDGSWSVQSETCPSCKRIIIHVKKWNDGERGWDKYLVYPRGIARSPLPPEVPEMFAKDYRQAALVLGDSPEASAALSRRCLQHVLREAGKTKKKDLADQIDEVMPTLSPALQGMIDTVRVMGNFAAHPTKSTHTGEIIEVEPGEAEWLLETLEQVFEHYFVQPAVIQKKRDAINSKLKEANKPPLK